MPAETLFWGIAAGVVLASLGLVIAPLLRGAGRGGRRASYDMQVFRDQLREIESDRARGMLTEDEAKATRVEIARRLLSAADAETVEAVAAAAPRAVSRAVAAGLFAAMLVAAAGLYTRLGAPGLPDQPLRGRLEQAASARADRPGQAAVEAMVAALPKTEAVPPASPEDLAVLEQLRAVLERNPADARAHRFLAERLGALGRWPEARAAQAEVTRLLGPAAPPRDLVAWVEWMVLAANGYVSPEAEAALGRALRLDPGNPPARYYSGLALSQAGRPDLALDLWTGLLAEGPPDAPWIAAIEARIDAVAQLAGRPPPDAAAAPRGPGQADIDAAAAMTPEDRQAMVAGMVDQLSARLEAEGGSVEDWAKLIRALGVMGRMDAAAEAWADAQSASAGNGAALARLAVAAREAGLTQ